ncbi:MFS transporter [Janibacter cremeus]|uniref:MFS family permease n=1 Tax=Janibacter cremeus TaxID=1285192 RepID=A0A852VRL8_9MICO|nr:MFS family permease [Janibacter cremeus]
MTVAHTTPVWRLPGMPVLLMATVAGFSGFSALLPVAPLWAAQGGADSAGVGAVNGVLMLFTVLTQPFVPAAVRRFGWGPVMAAGQLLLGLPALLHLVSDDLTWVLVLAAVRGLGFGILTVTGSAAVANLVDPRRRGQAVGIYGLGIAVPQVVFMPIGPWVAQDIGFWLVFAAGALPIVGAVPAWLAGRSLIIEPDDSPVTHSRAQVYRSLLRAMLLLLGVTLAGGALITFSSELAGAAWLATAALLVLTGAAALTRWKMGALADIYGTRPFLWPLVLSTTIGLALVAVSLTRDGALAAVLLLLGVLCVGISYGALQNLTLLLAFASVSRRDYGTASAVWNIGFDAGTGLGSVLVGAIAAGASFTQALLVAAVLSLATLPLALVRGRPAAR